jgi:hypothetical protein
VLQVDLCEPDAKVADLITCQCAKHGTAASVKIFRAPVPFAIIGMGDAAQSVELAEMLKACAFGPYVILNLEHVGPQERPETAEGITAPAGLSRSR